MKRMRASLVLAFVLLTAACTNGGGGNATPSSGGSSGSVNVVFWHGYTGAAAKEIDKLAAEYTQTHPGVTISPFFLGDNSYALQKIETAIAGGVYPDISYLYGSFASNIATVPQTVILNQYVQNDPNVNWKDFWPVCQRAATVGGKIVGFPALVDNLALVYNKKLFDEAGLAYPNPSWTWTDFRNAAKALTDPAKKQFGWSMQDDQSDSTTWRFMPFLWSAGGDLLNSDNTKAIFNEAPGVKALTLLQQMTTQDHSVYLDSGDGSTSLGLFTSGHIAMYSDGPWDLGTVLDSGMNFGITTIPKDQVTATISGPDDWVVFDNGTARKNAAIDFLKWFTAPQQDIQWAIATGLLPIRQSESQLPDYQKFLSQNPGIQNWVSNEANAIKNLPQVATFPKISEAIATAVASALLGKATPQQALDSAAQQVDAALAGG
ncbi:MAG: ABC transporter substrate-binding protein [Actinomycetota bacterium]